ncbi:hypothetical protein [Mycobacterium terramassiliense]|uniref:Uncharacterized protein n=1 Tax=Mycobacterium terramassiliense TaxID=1841859 RepID=A0A2U3NA55_9MYCO|nr:hypothetical protein [Mycobacterium terramassiliense]SPM28411.1 hypothetical protein MTAB308_1897 [Mycobacterium terramassiliense]
MGRQDEGRWDVSVKSNAVCVERISDGDKQLFEDLLAPQEARELAGLLTKYADKADESEKSDESGESKAKSSDKSEDASDESEDASDKSEDDSDESEDDSDESDDSDN